MNRRAALAALHVSVALFGFAALFGKWIALPATSIVLGRTAIAALTLGVVIVARRERIGRADVPLVVNGAILALHWVAFFAAVQVASAAVALLGYASFPVFVLLLDGRPRRGASLPAWGTAALAVAGLLALASNFSWSDSGTEGLALGVVSAITFAWLTLRNRALVARGSPMRIALWQNVFAAACLLPIVAAGGGWTARPTAVTIASLVVLGVVCTGFAHTLFIASMRRVSAQSASVVAALEPVYGIALAAWLLHETPGSRTLAGGILIVAAAVMASLVDEIGGRRRVSVRSVPEKANGR